MDTRSQYKTHDKYMGFCLQEEAIGQAFLERILPDRLKAQIQWDTLGLWDKETVDKGMRRRVTDVVYTANLKGGGKNDVLLMVFEHKSYLDKWAPFQ